jgi:hypothetical protein
MTRDLERRIAKLEARQYVRASLVPNFKNLPTSQLLDELAEATWQMKDLALADGDYHTALACIDSLYRTLPLRARLRGEVGQAGSADSTDLELDDERGIEIAQMFLKRRQQRSPGGDH